MSINVFAASVSHDTYHAIRRNLRAVGPIPGGVHLLGNGLYFYFRTIARVAFVGIRCINLVACAFYSLAKWDKRYVVNAFKRLTLTLFRVPLGFVQLALSILGSLGQCFCIQYGTKLQLLMHKIDVVLDRYDASLDSDYSLYLECFPEYELIVERDEILKSPVKVLQEFNQALDKYGHVPMIRYQISGNLDRVGHDAGGISRSFVAELMKALFSPDSALPKHGTQNGVVPLVKSLEDCNSYRALGSIFALALNGTRSILTGNHLNFTVFQMIHALTQNELNQIPEYLSASSQISQPLQDKLLKIYLKSELPSAFGDTTISDGDLNIAIDHFVDKCEINDWMAEVSPVESKEKFLEAYELNQILLATFVIAKSIQQHLKQPSAWDSLKGTTAEELRQKIEGSLTKEQVTTALTSTLAFDRLDVESQQFITKWIQDASDEQLKQFVFCISGSTTLNPLQKLYVNLQGSNLHLPAFHTCSFTMDMPKYEQYQTFKEKLELSIQSILAGNVGGLV